jgi:hypothetical protein
MASVVVLLIISSSSSAVSAVPQLWPLPQSYSHGVASASLDPESFFGVAPTPMLERAFARYSKIIFVGCGATGTEVTPNSTIKHLEFTITAPNAAGPAEHMDEWYELEVPMSGPAVARARTQWGALRALETLSQVVDSCTVTGLPLAIADAPRFTHRGIMLDLARVWWSMDGVRGVLDAMQYSKLNVLHLHLTDSEAFPVETSALNATRASFDPKNGCRAPMPSSSIPPESQSQSQDTRTHTHTQTRTLYPELPLPEDPDRCTYSQASCVICGRPRYPCTARI